MQSVVRATKQSNKRQLALRNIQRTLGLKPRSPKAYVPGRWNSVCESARRFIQMYDEFKVLFASCAFDDSKAVEQPSLLTAEDVKSLQVLVEVLSPLSVMNVFCQGAQYLTLPFVPFLVVSVRDVIREGVSVHAGPVEKTFRDSLLSSIERRLVEPTLGTPGPAILAALLHPYFGKGVLRHCPDDSKSATSAGAVDKLVEWMLVLRPGEPEAADGDPVDEPEDDETEKEMFGSTLAGTPVTTGRGYTDRDCRQLLKRFFRVVSSGQQTISWMLSPTPLLSRPAQNPVQLLYCGHLESVGFTPDEASLMRELAGLVLSAPASSATAERFFSAAGRIHAPWNMNIETLEKLSVLKFFDSQVSPNELAEFNRYVDGAVRDAAT